MTGQRYATGNPKGEDTSQTSFHKSLRGGSCGLLASERPNQTNMSSGYRRRLAAGASIMSAVRGDVVIVRLSRQENYWLVSRVIFLQKAGLGLRRDKDTTKNSESKGEAGEDTGQTS